jgi:hypothetical protein
MSFNHILLLYMSFNLTVVVVGEIDPVAHAGHEVRVRVEHLSHEVAVASKAHYEVSVVGVVHELHKHLDHLYSV